MSAAARSRLSLSKAWRTLPINGKGSPATGGTHDRAGDNALVGLVVVLAESRADADGRWAAPMHRHFVPGMDPLPLPPAPARPPRIWGRVLRSRSLLAGSITE